MRAAFGSRGGAGPDSVTNFCCTGVRFWVACYVVLLLGVYQLATSGLLGGIPSLNPDSAPLRWGVLAGLAALLAPLLLLWLGSGPLLIRQRGARLRDAGAEEAGSAPAGVLLVSRLSAHLGLADHAAPACKGKQVCFCPGAVGACLLR